MPLIAYKEKKFQQEALDVIEDANLILHEYGEQGFTLTLRQLYYQFVARDIIPNTERSYKRLGSIINDARMAGLIDWFHLIDRTRNLQALETWEDASDIMRDCCAWFRMDLWADQPSRVEVWVEKDALVGVVQSACEPLQVPYFSCRGYTSQSEMWRAAMRLHGHLDDGQTPVIIHLGDHDPSGIDMSRDIEERLSLFLDDDSDSPSLQFERIALNMDQIEEFSPPPNPAKVTDSRYNKYRRLYGDKSWELDALEPAAMVELITERVLRHRNETQWSEALEKEAEESAQLQGAVEEIA